MNVIQSCARPRRLECWLLFALLAVTLVVFAGVGGHDFVHFDDNINIYENPHLKGLSAESLQWMFTDAGYARRYMPLGWMCYAVDQQFFGLNPRVYFAGNLLLHLINVTLLFLLLKRMLRLAGTISVGEESNDATVWCAAAGALFWAVNPLRVENVAWASSRIYSVAFLLVMLWLLAWLRARDPRTPEARRPWLYWASVACYAASLLTYPLALFAPVALFALEIFPLRHATMNLSDWCGPGAGRLWRDKLPFLVIAAAGLALTFWARTTTGVYNQPATFDQTSLLSRVMQGFYVWAYYAWKPWAPFDLAPIYPTLHAFNPLAVPFLSSAVAVPGATIVLWFVRRRWPALLALWCCHLFLLVPFLGLTERNHSPADRYSYLHGVLWAVAIAFVLRALRSRGRRDALAGLFVAAACLMFGLLAWRQVPAWSNTIALHRHLIARLGEHPDRARFDEVLAVHYLRAGLTNEAAVSYENAIHYETRRPDRRRADDGVLARSHVSLGNILADQSNRDAAIAHYRAALQADPRCVSAAVNLGMTYAAQKRLDEAQRCFEEALRISPASIPAHHNLGTTLRQMGREDEARHHFQEASRLFAEK